MRTRFFKPVGIFICCNRIGDVVVFITVDNTVHCCCLYPLYSALDLYFVPINSTTPLEPSLQAPSHHPGTHLCISCHILNSEASYSASDWRMQAGCLYCSSCEVTSGPVWMSTFTCLLLDALQQTLGNSTDMLTNSSSVNRK